MTEVFLSQIRDLLGAEFPAFYESYKEPPRRGLRLNLLKTTTLDGLPLGQAVPWCEAGFTFPETERPAKSIFYHSGLFYIQEPSAMCPAEVLKPKPGHMVLDLCAAPGGKSAQIAGHMQNQGLLMSNDASPSRSRALVKNLERAGVTNAVVLTEQPKKLAERFPAFFDRILVDAPCSGEGMFRRDADAVNAYNANKPEACAAVQKEIPRHAAVMLKPGGQMVYSTCTFNHIENEGVIAAFLENHKDFSLMPINHTTLGVQPGRAEWVNSEDLRRTARIWPHLAPGEGHFIALIEKAGDNMISDDSHMAHLEKLSAPKEFLNFCQEFLKYNFTRGHFVTHGINLYFQPKKLDLHGLRVARSGWHLGECAKGRFIPSQALAMGLKKEQALYPVELSEANARRYLRGDSIEFDNFIVENIQKPWILICHQGFPLGWARLVQGRLKNNLPVGWAVSS